MNEQEALHQALIEALDLLEGEVLTGWIVVYETLTNEGGANCGHFYGPETMTTWRAMGLVEWARMRTLPSSVDVDEDD